MSLQQTPSPILILGPAYAGKSEQAMRYLAPDKPALVVGTADAREPGFAARLAALRDLRPAPWDTLETTHDLPAALAVEVGRYPQLLVDSVSLWLAAATIAEPREAGVEAAEARLLAQVDELLAIVTSDPARRVVLVSAEAGAGLAPSRPVERFLRRLIGLANQRLARAARTVIEVRAGIPLTLKGRDPEAP